MKVFIHYKPKRSQDAFEGTRIRKNLKGACESADITWVDSLQKDVEIAHFLSPRDLILIKEAKAKGIKTVLSVGFAEDDPGASFYEKTFSGKNVFLEKAILTMKSVDLILVPEETTLARVKEVLPDAKVEILPPAVNIERFSKVTTEAKIFRRYFGLTDSAKIVCSCGNYGDYDFVKLLKKTAKLTPNIQFYFFGAVSRFDPFKIGKRFRSAFASPNMHFLELVQDDIYRSALMNSIAYISNDDWRLDSVSALEAFASKTQVVTIRREKGEYTNPLFIEGKTILSFDSEEKLSEYLVALYNQEAETTIISAYEMAKSHSLELHGSRLNAIYQALIHEAGDSK